MHVAKLWCEGYIHTQIEAAPPPCWCAEESRLNPPGDGGGLNVCVVALLPAGSMVLEGCRATLIHSIREDFLLFPSRLLQASCVCVRVVCYTDPLHINFRHLESIAAVDTIAWHERERSFFLFLFRIVQTRNKSGGFPRGRRSRQRVERELTEGYPSRAPKSLPYIKHHQTRPTEFSAQLTLERSCLLPSSTSGF